MFGVLMKKANVDTDTDPLAKGECRGKIGYRYEAGNVTELQQTSRAYEEAREDSYTSFKRNMALRPLDSGLLSSRSMKQTSVFEAMKCVELHYNSPRKWMHTPEMSSLPKK